MYWFRHLRTMIIASLLAMGSWAVAADPPPPEFVDGEVLVKYRDTRAPQRAVHYRSIWQLSTVDTFAASGIRRVRVPEQMTVDQAVALYRSDPDVLYAEPNYRYRLQALPDAPRSDELWGLRNEGQRIQGASGTRHADIDAERAWNLETGSRDIVVAVIDSGLDVGHPDLALNLWTNPGEIADNGVDDDGNGFVDDLHGWDFADDDNLPFDSHGHGTHVAGIIGASGNNAEGIAGVCWGVSIMPLRFITAAEYGTTADAIAAIEYASQNGADVINLSWGGPLYSQALKDAIDAADAIVVCAAGNEGADLDVSPLYPASYDSANVLSVAATDADDHPAWFTNYSIHRADVAAPGTDVLSTIPNPQVIFGDTFSTADNWVFGGTGSQWGVERLPSGRQVLTESPGSTDYSPNMDTWAVMATPLDLSGRSGARMDFQVVGATADGGDGLMVEASTDQINWTRLWVGLEGQGLKRSITGSLPTWQWVAVDLGGFDGMDAVYLRLRFFSNATGSADGYAVADLVVTSSGAGDEPGLYQYYQGTSMAAAFASGTAALVLSSQPSLTPIDVKLILETSVDQKPQLAGYVGTAGRINAFNALASVASVALQIQTVASDRIGLDWVSQDPAASGFEIWRRDDAGGDFVTIATADPADAAYTDTGLSANTTYSYRILTLSGSARTGYSNEVSATTFSAAAVDLAGTGQGGGGGGGCFIGTMRD